MKFGGTSVGDESCIEKVVAIIEAARCESIVVVVVSAMSGVTNKLIEAATRAAARDRKQVTAIFEELRQQHHNAASALIHTDAERSRISHTIDELFRDGHRFCRGTILLGELTPRVRDSIASLGERLSAPLVAAALRERGVPSEAIEATEFVVTDAHYGAADPWMDLTRERSRARLCPVLERGVVPVVTGYIGATEEGDITTLGRGGSDYSATILGAALNAKEVIIWSDVDGLLTADPRQVADTCAIHEISYHEAAELAHFGAKVLHPKTIRALMPYGVPLWIRNTFSPEAPGTKITPNGPPSRKGVKALTAISDVALITLSGPDIAGVPDVSGRTSAVTTAVRADVILISQSSLPNGLCLVVPSAIAERTVEALRREFAQELADKRIGEITLDPNVAIVTGVGQNMRGVSKIVGRTFGALGRENVNLIAIVEGRSENSFSLVVAKKDAPAALLTLHREFQMDRRNPQPLF